MKRSLSLSLPITIITLAAFAACKSDRTPASDTASAGATTAATAGQSTAASPTRAGVTITSPAEGATTGKDVTVTMRAEGVTIAKADGAKVEGVGHYHLFLDTIPTPDNTPIPATTKKIVHIGTGDSTFTFKGLAPGNHQIIAVIGYGDHSPMPAGRDTVNIVVKP
jgi:hypothetical protein